MTPLMRAESLVKRFGSFTAVDQLSFSVQPGEVVGLLGANGAGKTTTMKMLLGLLAPTAGSVMVGGKGTGQVDRRTIGYVPQGLGLYRDLTVNENLEFAAAAFGVEPPELDEELGAVADRRIGQLSLGVQRRVAFVVARCHEPSVLILDEPTSGVGPLGRARLWETIREAASDGAAVLVSTHYMEEAEECDRAVLMASGRAVAEGSASQIISTVSAVRAPQLNDESIAQLRRAGNTVLLGSHGWRIVGADVEAVREIVGSAASIEEVPATFEEAFVALSR